MKFKITSRDFKFFFLGIFAAFVFATIYDWDDNVKDFKEGFESGISGKYVENSTH